MTVEEKNKALLEKFRIITAQVATGDPDDFDTQLPLQLVAFHAEDSSMVCYFEVDRKFGNPYGIAHGGIVATMLDIAQGAAVAAYTEMGRRISTVSLQISYFKPVYTGKRFYVRTKITGTSGTMAYCSAETWQEEGTLTNSAASVYHLGKKRT